MAAWDFNIEFSGITIVHLSGGVDGKKTGKAFLSKGISGRHKPWLLVPMEGLRNDAFGDTALAGVYGLATIPVPGGGHLLQVGLEGCTVNFGTGIKPGGTVFYVNNRASEKDAPADWSDISYVADIARLAQVKKHKRNFAAKCSGSVTLPSGRLTCVPPSLADRARRPYWVRWVMSGGKKKDLWSQRVAERLRLTVECDQPATRIMVKKKDKPLLSLTFGPPDGSGSELAITFSSNCAAGTGSADELMEFGALLAPATGFSPTIDGPGPRITDDHPCFNGFWID